MDRSVSLVQPNCLAPLWVWHDTQDSKVNYVLRRSIHSVCPSALSQIATGSVSFSKLDRWKNYIVHEQDLFLWSDSKQHMSPLIPVILEINEMFRADLDKQVSLNLLKIDLLKTWQPRVTRPYPRPVQLKLKKIKNPGSNYTNTKRTCHCASMCCASLD